MAVVHMVKPYGLVDFVQQTGRGGRRAGEVVRSVIIHNGRAQREDQYRSFVDNVNQAQIEAFISTPGCRRAVISAFIDGVAGETCKGVDRAELYDRCVLLGRDDDSGESGYKTEGGIKGETTSKTSQGKESKGDNIIKGRII